MRLLSVAKVAVIASFAANSLAELFTPYAACSGPFNQYKNSNLPQSSIEVTKVESGSNGKIKVTVHFTSETTASINALSELKIMTPVNGFIFSRNANVKDIDNPNDFYYTFETEPETESDGSTCVPDISFQFDWCSAGVQLVFWISWNVTLFLMTSLMIFTLDVKIPSTRVILSIVTISPVDPVLLSLLQLRIT